MESKINLDHRLVKEARSHAKSIALDMQNFIDEHTTVSVERTILRLLGIDGVDDIALLTTIAYPHDPDISNTVPVPVKSIFSIFICFIARIFFEV